MDLITKIKTLFSMIVFKSKYFYLTDFKNHKTTLPVMKIQFFIGYVWYSIFFNVTFSMFMSKLCEVVLTKNFVKDNRI